MTADRRALKVRVRRLPAARGLPLPEAASAGSAGIDLRAAVEDQLTVQPGRRVQIPTGLIFEIPRGWEGQVRPRSGLAARYGVTVTNAPGTIDSDYRGEVRVLLINHGDDEFVVRRGDRVAQMVLAPVVAVELSEVEELENTERGAGGFGSTGVD